MWIDLPVSVLNAMSLIEGEHWKLLNPDGGLLLIQCMLNSAGGLLLMKEFQIIQKRSAKPLFEMLGLIEPHKVIQNNVIMIKRVTAVKYEKIEDYFTAPNESILESEARLINPQKAC